MMQRQKVKLLLWFVVLLSILALVVVPALAYELEFTLKVKKAGEGTGKVTSDDGKINCGAVCEATYGGAVRSGMLMGSGDGVEVTLTAIPDAGFAFAGWGGNCECASPLDGAGFDTGVETCVIVGQSGETRTCTVTFGLPVGGVAVPVNKLGLLAPWLGMAALASLAALTVALVRRRREG